MLTETCGRSEFLKKMPPQPITLCFVKESATWLISIKICWSRINLPSLVQFFMTSSQYSKTNHGTTPLLFHHLDISSMESFSTSTWLICSLSHSSSLSSRARATPPPPQVQIALGYPSNYSQCLISQKACATVRAIEIPSCQRTC